MRILTKVTTIKTSGETGDERDAEELTESAFNLRSVFLIVVVMATAMTPGNNMTFASVALPQMKRLSLDEISWYTSLTALAQPFGNLCNALTLDAYGRRVGMFVSMIPNTVGWYLLADEQASLTQLYLGRLLTGFSGGAASLPCIVYVAESITADSLRIRSAVGTWVVFFQVIGGLLMYLLSLILKYDEVALACCIASTISFFSILAFVPESPAWLYGQGRVGDAEIARQRLGMRQQSILRAKKLPPLSHRNGVTVNGTSKLDSRFPQNVMQYLAQIGRRDVYKPLMITIALMLACRFSGIYALLSNMVDVITVSPLESNSYTLSLVGQIIQIIGCLLLNFLLPRYGVKILTAVSFVGVSAGYLILAFSILFENRWGANVFNYLHILSVWSITLAAQLGVLSVPQAVLGELFPFGAKGFATFTMFVSSVFNFVVMKMFPYAFSQHRNIVFFVFSAVCASGATFVVACFPETVGKTLKEINEGFGKRTKESDGVEGE